MKRTPRNAQMPDSGCEGLLGHQAPADRAHVSRDAIVRFIIGTLDFAETARFERHLVGCASCGRALATEARREQEIWALRSANDRAEGPLAPVISLHGRREAVAAEAVAAEAVPAEAVPAEAVPAIVGSHASSAAASVVSSSAASTGAAPVSISSTRGGRARRGLAAGWASGMAAAALIGIFAGQRGLSFDGGGFGRQVDSGPVAAGPGLTSLCGGTGAERVCRAQSRSSIVAQSVARDEPAICTQPGAAITFGGLCEITTAALPTIAASLEIVSQSRSSPGGESPLMSEAPPVPMSPAAY